MKWKKSFHEKSPFNKHCREWQIRTDDGFNTPVALLPEPIGGEVDENGVNKMQKINAQMIETTPELLSALKECRKALKAINIVNTDYWVEKADKAIQKAEGIS